ncbi:DUF2141 domain-containing protein [Aquimarina sp. SS2-1]|uniref:DUF2141 domain-containing protein n=1 Tax=Aquimarina besae TaxID=3342247 RepID=UPI00367146EF
MKTVNYFTFFLFSFLLISEVKAQNNTSIQIRISNIESSKGTILIGLYNSESNFYKKTFRSAAVKAKKGSIQTSFEDIPAGEYGITLYHDENDNKILDTNFLKIPKEPYGTSNNAKGNFGPPKWEDAKFSVSNTEVVQSIKL